MRLLFDQNLSPRLPRLLADVFPDSMHVRDVGLRDADDATVWQYALANGLTIVSKDSDVQQRSLLFGGRQSSSGCVSATAPWQKAGNFYADTVVLFSSSHRTTKQRT